MRHFYAFLLLFLIGHFGFSQTTIFFENGGGSAPAGWTFENNITTNEIDRTSYWLVDAGNPSDVITTATYDLSAYTDAEFTMNIRSFGGGTHLQAKIEISYDGGTTYTQTETTITTTTSYTSIGTITLNSVSNQVVLRISNNGTSGRGVRMQDLELTASGTASTNDTDTEVYEISPQIAGATVIAADVTTVGTAFEVLGFEVLDQGTADGLATNITTMRFVPGTNNTADWTDAIQGATLVDGNSVTHTPTVTVTDTEIELAFGTPISVTDNTALEFSLGIYLNTTNIVDGSIIQLQIDESGSFDADTSGSDFVDPYLFGDVIGNDFTIDVVSTELAYVVQPSTTIINTVMSPNVEIAATDANGNIDIDYSGLGHDISVTTDGNFSGIATLTAEATDGIAVFDNLVFDTLATGIKLSATDDSPLITGTYDSDLFDVESIPVGPVTLWVEPFTDNSLYTVTLGGEGNDGIADYLQITDGSNINKTYTGNNGNFFAGQDIDDGGWTNSASPSQLTWSNIDISDYNTLNFSGSFASVGGGIDDSDYVLIEYSIDNGSWTNLLAFENNGSTFNTDFLEDTDFDEDGDGTALSDSFSQFTKAIAGTGTTLDIRITFALNSGDEEIAIEDFSLTGLPDATTYTYDGTTWSPSDPDGVSLATEAIVIESGSTSLTTDTDINTVTINPGAGLTIDTGVTLTVTTDLTLESNSTSYASLISDGTISGTVIYKRHVNTFNSTTGSTNGQNDLISAPVTDASQNFGAFRATNTNIPSGTVGGGTTTFYLFGPFDNNAATNPYILYSDADDAMPIAAGIGYRTASTDTSTFTFTGEVLTGNVPVTITTGSETEWNLIGNPYPSYINSGDFLTLNAANLDQNAVGIYGYDGDAANGWTVVNYNNLNTNTNLTPGQGFMVAAEAASATLNFTPSMRTVSGGDDFIAGRTTETNAYLSLQVANSDAQFTTDFYFNANSTRSLDPGYDAAMFNSQLPSLNMYSHLVENNIGTKMTIQSLSETDLTDVIIPLGVHANQLEQITFSIAQSTLPSSVEVYLEDNVTNTFTLLTDGDYTITPNANLNGTGRFYLRFTTTALSTAETTLDQISIYNNQSDKTIVIAGQLTETTTANLYDIQGRKVSSTLLQSSSRSQTIDVSNLSTGVYIVELQNGLQNKTQKVILQ
ncbi:T9SS type A sorting domain-containing protein [Winogradskyella eckloniae]|uniref:T9SS type A sorting domain-containing protein n=1 Tax=Winogradskyella eckloniae TaxID=1089306 RepID=UPI001565FAFA|nr:T9SS type A sorting domain-containing protein [Winogradskyella eckloniae]NRD20791.1 T9SS type A sorting domain-containing protein [Winogradskyella eckloniae]